MKLNDMHYDDYDFDDKTAAMGQFFNPTRVAMMCMLLSWTAKLRIQRIRRQEKRVPLELQELPEIQVSPALRALPVI